MWWTWSSSAAKPGFVLPASSKPPVGNQPSWTANSTEQQHAEPEVGHRVGEHRERRRRRRRRRCGDASRRRSRDSVPISREERRRADEADRRPDRVRMIVAHGRRLSIETPRLPWRSARRRRRTARTGARRGRTAPPGAASAPRTGCGRGTGCRPGRSDDAEEEEVEDEHEDERGERAERPCGRRTGAHARAGPRPAPVLLAVLCAPRRPMTNAAADRSPRTADHGQCR